MLSRVQLKCARDSNERLLMPSQVEVPWISVFSATNIMDMELIILGALQWRLGTTTAAAFVDPLLDLLYRTVSSSIETKTGQIGSGNSGCILAQLHSKHVRHDAKRYLYYALQGQSLSGLREARHDQKMRVDSFNGLVVVWLCQAQHLKSLSEAVLVNTIMPS